MAARPVKHEYRIALPAKPARERSRACVGLKLRPGAADDAEALGALMLDAYRGTLDDEGEDLSDAVAQVRGFFAGKSGRPIPEASIVAWRGSTPVCFCAVAWLEQRGCPFVAYIVTASAAKGQGVGRFVLETALKRAARAGHGEVRAFITDGNAPSERLFAAAGFARVEQG
jgi:GNAT superfamily N-acetyltransferase